MTIKQMNKSILLMIAIILATVFPIFAQNAPGGIIVTADAKNANPTLIFNGELSDQTLSAKILSDFQHCDWFNVLKSGTAAYHVAAKGNLQDFTVTISNSAGVALHPCIFKKGLHRFTQVFSPQNSQYAGLPKSRENRCALRVCA